LPPPRPFTTRELTKHTHEPWAKLRTKEIAACYQDAHYIQHSISNCEGTRDISTTNLQ